MTEAAGRNAELRRHRFQPYPEYKDSGVEWPHEIPAHWEVRRLKDRGALVAGAGFPHDYQGISDEVLPFYKVGDLSASSDGRHMGEAPNTVSLETAAALRAKVIPENSVLYAKIGAALLLNRRRLTTLPCCIDNNMSAYVPGPDVASEWAFHWMETLDFAAFVQPGAVPSLSEGDQAEIPIVIPPMDEQHAIVALLHKRTAQIDALVTKKKQLIELLQEKRRALITLAVTQGLDPNVPMKDSGVKWLGQIPVHWASSTIKRLARPGYKTFTDGDWIESPFITTDGIRLIQTGNIGIGKYREKGFRYISEETFRHFRCTEIEPGDILICRLGEPVARACLAPQLSKRMITSVDVCILKLRAGADAGFLVYSMSSSRYLNWVGSLVRGSTRDRVSRSMLGSFVGPFPPPGDQRAIAGFLDSETAKIAALIARIREAIHLLNEYRTALISAAVTGQIDVRNQAA